MLLLLHAVGRLEGALFSLKYQWGVLRKWFPYCITFRTIWMERNEFWIVAENANAKIEYWLWNHIRTGSRRFSAHTERKLLINIYVQSVTGYGLQRIQCAEISCFKNNIYQLYFIDIYTGCSEINKIQSKSKFLTIK